MNKNDRKEPQEIIEKLEFLQEAEQEKYDNAPENLQESERVTKFQDNADQLQEVIDTLTYLWEDY